MVISLVTFIAAGCFSVSNAPNYNLSLALV